MFAVRIIYIRRLRNPREVTAHMLKIRPCTFIYGLLAVDSCTAVHWPGEFPKVNIYRPNQSTRTLVPMFVSVIHRA